MIKSLFHIATSVLILLMGMNYSIIQAEFYLNRAKIAEALCENKNKPELACDGLCVLGNRLSEEKEKNESSIIYEFQIFLYILPDIFELDKNDSFPNCRQYTQSSTQQLISQLSLDFFHPPKI
ncbi:hypothetical protein [Mongoliitalea daihaiensis]|jgi:hypothetical protein|uniref:hypothetical protein n=1 Tax=Mongoliitalea daihaiensis TaxID=2782006 RepID=UPI001F159675|nr:hypothetical protein [Mongoliitalea daihaiensis]UJP63604.1 hypothetical protein IPZ59_12230 [Mongoliitalea daihaiensis]UJP63609.1 hypothetical protein IPZ59_12255 [Mongoliitalea daihaiensis]